MNQFVSLKHDDLEIAVAAAGKIGLDDRLHATRRYRNLREPALSENRDVMLWRFGSGKYFHKFLPIEVRVVYYLFP
jgi:hypothetical protein